MRNTGISNPARHWVNYAPIKDQFVHDPHAPDDDHHALHLDAVDRSSAGWGFPVAPCARVWPPKTASDALGQRRVWR